MTMYPRSHIYLGVAYESTKVKERPQHNFLILSDEISSICAMEILSHRYIKELKSLLYLATNAREI